MSTTLEDAITAQASAGIVEGALPAIREYIQLQVDNIRREMQRPKLITAPEAAEMCGISKGAWYDLVNDGYAPQPVTLNDKSLKRWDKGEVESYIEKRKAMRKETTK